MSRSSDLSGRVNGTFSLILGSLSRYATSAAAGAVRNLASNSLAGIRGPAEEIALSLFAAHPDQEVGRGAVLNAFGDDGQAQLLAKPDGRTDDRRVVGIGQQAQYERAVDLQPVEREFLQIVQAGVFGAEIVEDEANG